jgi:23S rRNA G2069 N7-methylase RlmK/C1962 C5-methylase RlmI
MCEAAARAGRPLRRIEETSHALDHPLDFAESRYLKCLFAKA